MFTVSIRNFPCVALPVQFLSSIRYSARIFSQKIVAHAENVGLHVFLPVDTLNVNEELLAIHLVLRVDQLLEVLRPPRPLVGGEVLQGFDRSVNFLVDRCQADGVRDRERKEKELPGNGRREFNDDTFEGESLRNFLELLQNALSLSPGKHQEKSIIERGSLLMSH